MVIVIDLRNLVHFNLLGLRNSSRTLLYKSIVGRVNQRVLVSLDVQIACFELILFQALRLMLIKPFDSGLAWLLLHLTLKRWVEMVLNVIISAAIQELCDFRPFVAVSLVELQYFVVLFFTPTVFLYVGIQMVVPSLSTLLSYTTFQIISDLTPILGSVSSNLFDQKPVFFFGPGTFYHLRVQNFLPSVQTLHVRSKFKFLGNLFPVFWTHLLD